MKRKYNNQLNTMSEKNSTLTLKRGILNTVNSDVELKQRHLYASSNKVQEVIVTIEENNEKLYRQYRALMQRNNELLDLVEQLQKELEDVKKENKLIKAGGEELALLPINSKLEVIKEEGNVEFIMIFNRVSGLITRKKKQRPSIEAQAKMLKFMYDAQTGLTPDELFKANGLSKVTGYRYAKFFKLKGFVEYCGSKKQGWYEMTKLGRLFVEGKV